jgi:diphthine synthase
MVLWFIGLGLGDAGDITVKGKDALKQSKFVYLEAYTSILPGLDRAALAEAYGPLPLLEGEFIEADRELVESGCEEMLERAKEHTVSFLVVGDALCATTHTDLWLRAKKLGIEVQVVHNASCMNAIAACGLQLYRFGETVSIPFWSESAEDTWKPDSFYDKIVANRKGNLHTLCLLDIKVKEQTIENLMRGKKVYEPPRFMTVAQALSQLMEIEAYRKEGVATADTKVVGVARLGRQDQAIACGKCSEVIEADIGGPLHSLVIPAEELHDMESEFLDFFQCGAARSD